MGEEIQASCEGAAGGSAGESLGARRTWLVDDRGPTGEYADFLTAHRERLPEVSLNVMSSWAELVTRMGEGENPSPDLILLDMHFDVGPAVVLCGDLQALASSVRFAGDVERAEAQLRRLQGVFILQALREDGYTGPVVLFGTLPTSQSDRINDRYAPVRIVEGLLFDGVREALCWARGHRDEAAS